MEEIEFEQVDSASAGAVGEPGSRVFLIQGRKLGELVSVLVEKQQVELLAEQSIEFLDSLIQDFPENGVTTPEEFDRAGELVDQEPLFRAQSIGLIFDPETKLVTLELRESQANERMNIDTFGMGIPAEFEDNERVLRMSMTRTQLRAMAVKGTEAVNSGREICPLCQNPMNVTGHICPRLN